MPEKIPPFPTDFKPPSYPSAGQTVRTYDISLITPMFGGGAIAGEPDPVFPIRATAIRGQLRHWWRLVKGLALGDAMWRREEEIFGSTDFPSPLCVRVLDWTPVKLFDPSDRSIVPQFSAEAYALFPAIENKRPIVAEGVRFHVELSWPKASDLNARRKAQNNQRRKGRKTTLPESIEPIDSDVLSAFQAWGAFGGYGGRTRRGCGALHVNDDAFYAAPGPRIPARIILGAQQRNPLSAWAEAVKVYREFRQTPRGALHQKTLKNGKSVNVPGRSHWPEADSIRQITGCSLKPPTGTVAGGVPVDQDTHDHSKPVAPSGVLPSFPKALLGLPINFHFADSPGRNTPGVVNQDPQDVQLYPLLANENGKWERAERMASPIITRPLFHRGAWHPAVIILTNPLPENFKARLEGNRAMAGGRSVSHDIPMNRLAGPELGAIRPMRNLASAVDALAAFLTQELKWSVQ